MLSLGARGVTACEMFCMAALVAATVVGSGCQTRCEQNFDCGEDGFCSALGRCERQCYTDEECLRPLECRNNPINCRPLGLFCNGVGRCVGTPDNIRDDGDTVVIDTDDLPDDLEGYEDTPGTGGNAFIVNRINVAPATRGFDVDGQCTDSGCLDNRLAPLGELANAQINQGLTGGESLLLLELAGLDMPYRGDDDSLTLKIYSAIDADVPFNPENNFRIPPRQTTCCEFRINPTSLVGTPKQAKARSPARIERGRLRSLAPVPVEFTLTIGLPPNPEIRLEQVLLSGRVPSGLDRFEDGLLGGALPINTLANLENPYCRTTSTQCGSTTFSGSSSLIDLISSFVGPRPDIDLDGDGLECVWDGDGDGAIDLCCDRSVSTCGISDVCAAPVSAIVPDQPWTCAQVPQIADGYSIALDFTAVRAKVVGVGQ